MCFGSAFIASNSSASFKVRKVLLTQHPVSAISIHITPANASRVADAQQETVSEDADTQETEAATTAGIQYDRSYQLYKKSDYLGQRKTLSLSYDTNMKIDVYAGEDSEGEHLATFTVNGIDEIADSELLKKENVTRPRVSLSFELSRTGLLLLNKAEAKVDETYYIDPPTPKPKKAPKNESADNTTTSSNDTTSDVNQTESEKPAKVQKKRTIPYSLNRIDKVIYGPASLTKEQIQKAKERLRWYERRDEERAKTDKAKNDFESIIYAMRSWISDYSDEHLPYIGSTEKQEELLSLLSSSEDWLLDGEGESATFVEYNKKHGELNDLFRQLKVRKDEHKLRPEALKKAHKRLEEVEDEAKDLPEKKPWLNQTHVDEILTIVKEVREWLSDVDAKQKAAMLSEDPVYRVGEVDARLTRVNAVLTRVSSI
jgi:hypothetical protein